MSGLNRLDSRRSALRAVGSVPFVLASGVAHADYRDRLLGDKIEAERQEKKRKEEEALAKLDPSVVPEAMVQLTPAKMLSVKQSVKGIRESQKAYKKMQKQFEGSAWEALYGKDVVGKTYAGEKAYETERYKMRDEPIKRTRNNVRAILEFLEGTPSYDKKDQVWQLMRSSLFEVDFAMTKPDPKKKQEPRDPAKVLQELVKLDGIFDAFCSGLEPSAPVAEAITEAATAPAGLYIETDGR